MQDRQVYEQEQVVIIDLQAVIPPNHLVRRVAKIVDLRFIYELTQDLYRDDNERPWVDPPLFSDAAHWPFIWHFLGSPLV
jgi:hypothetical protein